MLGVPPKDVGSCASIGKRRISLARGASVPKRSLEVSGGVEELPYRTESARHGRIGGVRGSAAGQYEVWRKMCGAGRRSRGKEEERVECSAVGA